MNKPHWWALTLALLLCGSGDALAQQVLLDRIVAVVNNDVVLESEVRHRLNQVRSRLASAQVEPPPAGVLARQVLERLILDKIQLQLADAGGIKVDDETLRQAVERLAQQNKLSLDEFRRAVENEGISFPEFVNELRTEILVGRLRNAQVNSQIKVTDREVDQYLKRLTSGGGRDTEYLLGHILIATPEAASPRQIDEARRKAERILGELRGGADFQQTALAESDAAQALEGGSLGWRKQADLPSLFTDLAPGLQVGELAGPIQSASGFHIIKLLDRRGLALPEVRQTNVRHILVRTSELVSDETARNRLLDFKRRIEAGESFEELARANSADRTSATRGGALGWVNPGALVPPFEAAMNRLQINELSEPVQTQFGWHLIQVLGRREHDESGDFLRNQAREALFKRKVEEETELWLRRIRDEAFIELRTDSP